MSNNIESMVEKSEFQQRTVRPVSPKVFNIDRNRYFDDKACREHDYDGKVTGVLAGIGAVVGAGIFARDYALRHPEVLVKAYDAFEKIIPLLPYLQR